MSPMIDSFGRKISYLRVSVTDRCDLRCSYCMSERMTFLPKPDLLTLEELSKLCHGFIDRGIRKIRISGGEPLVRRDVMELFKDIAPRLNSDLEELTLTTNATQLSKYVDTLAGLGVKRVNISLDSLKPDVFTSLTRRPVLDIVLDGVQAAKDAGLKIKINTVVLPENLTEIPDMVRWAHAQNFDLSLIEIMPMGQVEQARAQQFVPMQAAKNILESQFTLAPILPSGNLGGPARYHKVAQTGGRIGFISPLTNNFCAGCNRIRMTCTGRIYMCLGQDDYVDLRDIIRTGGDLNAAVSAALREKPEAHDFTISDRPGVARHMSVTGG